jgi:hypothetical protein
MDIDVAAFWDDPYSTLARLRRDAPAVAGRCEPTGVN